MPMQYNRRIVPPTLAMADIATVHVRRDLDDMWTGVHMPPARARTRGAELFPPARSDAEIAAIVDEFIDELCGPLY